MATRNPFDTAIKPGRSLFDRIEGPHRRDRDRSRSPDAVRRSNTSKPPPDGIDRYVPSSRSRRSRTRSPRGRSPRGRGRRSPIRGRGRDERARGGERGGERGDRTANGRPKKTQEDLDREMDDYWGSKKEENGVSQVQRSAPATTEIDGDIDMIS